MAIPVDIDQELRIADICPPGNTAQLLDLPEDAVRAFFEEEALLHERRAADAAHDPAWCAHVWPDQLDTAASCTNCHLPYDSWTI